MKQSPNPSLESAPRVVEKPAVLPAPPTPLGQATDFLARRSLSFQSAQSHAYPLLLLASTAMAAVFCFMYITKPTVSQTPHLVIRPIAVTEKPKATAEKTTPEAAPLLPNADRLPGDAQPPGTISRLPQRTNPRHALPAISDTPVFEETNLRIQHILTAESAGGDLSRIVLNVPVLYQSRNLGWTANETTEATELLKRLAAYQEATRRLREEGTRILAAWNHLVDRSIPVPVLRADSPSLPANQEDGGGSPRQSGLDTTESIQIQPVQK